MQEKNPYAAPVAPVEDVSDADRIIGTLIPGGRSVASDRAWPWIVGGFDLFKRSPGPWILALILLFLISAVLSVIPLGSLVLNVVFPVFVAGLLIGCHDQTQGEQFEVAHLFAGFREHAGQLMLVGLLYLLGVFAAALIGSLIFGVSMLGTMFGRGAGIPVTSMLLFALVVLALMIPLAMALWFAPALVTFHDVPAVDAMKQSFAACMKNIVPFLIYGLITLALAIAATIPLFLGWLILSPTLVGSLYYSYRDIFLDEQ